MDISSVICSGSVDVGVCVMNTVYRQRAAYAAKTNKPLN